MHNTSYQVMNKISNYQYMNQTQSECRQLLTLNIFYAPFVVVSMWYMNLYLWSILLYPSLYVSRDRLCSDVIINQQNNNFSSILSMLDYSISEIMCPPMNSLLWIDSESIHFPFAWSKTFYDPLKISSSHWKWMTCGHFIAAITFQSLLLQIAVWKMHEL